MWRRAVEMAPGHFGSLFNLGYLSVQKGRDEQAAGWLARAAKANSRDFNSRYLLGTVYLRQGKAEDALRAWRGALALQPGNRKLMQVMSVEYDKGRYFEEAARVAEAALRVAPEEESLYFLAMQARADAGEQEMAATWARRALAKFPRSARANFEVGYQLHKMGRWDEAMPYFEKAVAADGRYEEPHYLLGDVSLRREDGARAEREFRRAVELRGSYTLARLGLARALMAQGNLESALAELEIAAQVDPESPQPHLLRSQVLFRLGREDAARAARETSQRLRAARPETGNAVQPRPFPLQ